MSRGERIRALCSQGGLLPQRAELDYLKTCQFGNHQGDPLPPDHFSFELAPTSAWLSTFSRTLGMWIPGNPECSGCGKWEERRW